MPVPQIFRQAFDSFAQHFHQPLAQHLLAPVAAKGLPRHRVPQFAGLIANLDDLLQRQIGVMRAHTREITHP